MGALGSRANQQKRRERLRLFDLDESQIERLHGPVGLRIASKTPAEIAVAIAAELIWVRNTLGGAEAAYKPLASQRAPGLSRAAGPLPRAGPAYMGLSVVRLY